MKITQQYSFLIVAGTTKAATTSVFRYLADHPQVAAASYKETRFFLSPEYPLPAPARIATHPIAVYEGYFSPKGEQVCMESTPDYLHDLTTPARISREIPNIKILLLLRNPVSRLQSWYKFAQQTGYLPQSVTFEGYVSNLFAIEKPTQQYELALQQGKYVDYIKHWLRFFPKESIKICWYEELSDYPGKVMQSVASFGGIDPDFYQSYRFQAENVTMEMRRPGIHKLYHEFRYKLRHYTLKIPIIHTFFKFLRKTVEPLYLSINAKKKMKVSLNEEIGQKLAAYYRPSVIELAELTGQTPPWNF